MRENNIYINNIHLTRRGGGNNSNGIRFSITDVSPPTARLMPTVFQDRAGISLYDAQFSTQNGQNTRGPIPASTIEEVVQALERFQVTCDDFGVPAGNVYVLATEATRTAPNSAELRACIQARTGWEVRMLSKEEEGRIGALGIASSGHALAGLAMDLGGGSTQITWVVEDAGMVRTSPRGSFSFPYGAAALAMRLGEASGKGGKGKGKMEAELREEMRRNFRNAYRDLEIPVSLLEAAERKGRFDLYLCGGGFRGWGYMLMSQSKVNPYPIPIINGYRASQKDFHDTAAVLETASESDVKVFGVSKRRVSQIPAVALLVDVIMDALPAITHIQFCQGGVREGFLFDRLPQEIRAEHPLLAATSPYAPPSADAIRGLLQSALPTSPSPRTSLQPPESFNNYLLGALANLLYAHSHVYRASQSAAALHCTTTGILSSTNCLTHVDRALLALILCERWAGDLPPSDQAYYRQLSRCVSAQERWWCQYLGRIATLIGAVYPAGRIPEACWRIRFETTWTSVSKKKGTHDILHVRVKCNEEDRTTSAMQAMVRDQTEDIEKLGKKKNWIEEYGVRVGFDIC
ncbi:retrograde regulation protein 2 [Aspergillus clavatus NRRL 1]|uniref:Retrograde regulation protein 2 n=1 Tax=Aspergillus clavatus (strain ATCC 1007 / CBS 513.65 / DSM 816 / NCTC 3887 / NRRL 1 / QM 1276 / 107) TaxID=344612 RepID=A1CTA4_ASPCL|nr:retrograde regulation protein 2 [Aspergillus clavatus NRRL 1]EAW06541.1 retrograde regulation protein 2 [Aspergillus clavatus NRRL 1]